MVRKKLTFEQVKRFRRRLLIRKLVREIPDYADSYDSSIAGKVFCRSPYESQFVRFLDELSLDWRKGRESFKYKSCLDKKTHYWTPDYVILDEIGLPRFYIELKGVVRVGDIARWEAFPEDKKLVILADKDLKELGLDIREGYRRYRPGEEKIGWKKTGTVSESLQKKIDPQVFLDLVLRQETCKGIEKDCTSCIFDGNREGCRQRILSRDFVEPADRFFRVNS